MMAGNGIEAENRRRLDCLHRAFSGPFSVADAAHTLHLSKPKTRRLLALLANGAWLSRVRRDCYVTVPLGATSPGEWRGDPWAIAAKAFEPCYLGGWTACEHWGLTDQIFRDIVVFTGRRVRHRRAELQVTSYWLKTIPDRLMFGTHSVWHGRNRVLVSDPSRTLIDLLDDPATGGSMRHVAEIAHAYFSGDERTDATLVEYARRHGNRTVYKRLGYLVEASGLDAPTVLEACRTNMSAGLSALDPSGPDGGRILKRWNLRLNVTLDEQGEAA
jgi:predicted transcriptional regulator of viral defense system